MQPTNPTPPMRSTARNKRMTMSQHRAHATTHADLTAAKPRRKWYGVTISRMQPDGTMDTYHATESTGRVTHRAIHDRRGKVIAANEDIA